MHGHKRKNYSTKPWDFYVISPNGKKFRSNKEITKYLTQNPGVECDLDVTNCTTPSDHFVERLHPVERGEEGRGLRENNSEGRGERLNF